jgi:hypothetical protein
LEFYVFTRGNRLLSERKYHHTLQKLGERLSSDAGLHVEFKVDSLARLRKSPVTIFSHDLVSGHRILFGEGNIFLGCEHHLDANKIPLSEATRLLFNRCTGLLLAKEFLNNSHLTIEQADFIGRNLAKTQLALGDAVLTASGEYHWSCLERHDRLNRFSAGQFPWLAEVKRHHAAGVEFKLHPQQISKSREEFQKEHSELSSLALQIWLWLENRRLNRQFSSAHDYAFSPVSKCDDTPAWKNILLNTKAFGLPALFDDQSSRYPRERLLNSLPLLLWDEPKDLRVRRYLQNQLRTTASDWQSFVMAYTNVWPGFS